MTAVAGLEGVRRFGELSRAYVPFASGKGANLGELTLAGLPVPPGFVVEAPAYAAFCDAGGLRGHIEARPQVSQRSRLSRTNASSASSG